MQKLLSSMMTSASSQKLSALAVRKSLLSISMRTLGSASPSFTEVVKEMRTDLRPESHAQSKIA